MLKIVRGLGPVYGNAEPVVIDNRVFIPTEDEETGEMISAEEQRRREDAEKAEEERRFKEAVDAKVAQILNDRAEALERERAKIVEDAKAQASTITADAKASTMAVIEKAERECVKIKEIARQEGQTEGFAEGKAEALEKYRKYVEAAGDLLSEINSRKEAYYISHEEDLRQTVFAVAEKVVHAELRAFPEVIDNILADAAKNFRNSDYIKIILKEEDMTERYRTDEKLINKIIPFIPEIEIVYDSDTEEGTIVLDNGSEIVDASIPTQLDFLKEILQNTRGESDSLTAGDSAEDVMEAAAIGAEDMAAGAADMAAGAKNTAAEAKNMAAGADNAAVGMEEAMLGTEDEVPGTDGIAFADILAQAAAEMTGSETSGAETAGAETSGAETMGIEAAGAETSGSEESASTKKTRTKKTK